jgi:hypothetical protein
MRRKSHGRFTPEADISDVLHQVIWTNQGYFAGFIWYSIFSKDRS